MLVISGDVVEVRVYSNSVYVIMQIKVMVWFYCSAMVTTLLVSAEELCNISKLSADATVKTVCDYSSQMLHLGFASAIQVTNWSCVSSELVQPNLFKICKGW